MRWVVAVAGSALCRVRGAEPGATGRLARKGVKMKSHFSALVLAAVVSLFWGCFGNFYSSFVFEKNPCNFTYTDSKEADMMTFFYNHDFELKNSEKSIDHIYHYEFGGINDMSNIKTIVTISPDYMKHCSKVEAYIIVSGSASKKESELFKHRANKFCTIINQYFSTLSDADVRKNP